MTINLISIARKTIREAVTQAAPVIANQRNLAIAQTRAASDALTGLPNRRAASSELKRMAAHAIRTNTPLGILLLDLDHFKQINDRFGHDRGDEVLSTAGSLLTAAVRGGDFASRYGGEEFLILAPGADVDGARDLAEKVRQTIGQAQVDLVGPISASIGVAVFPTHATDTDLLIRRADEALYRAKELGRNRVEVSSVRPPPGTETAVDESTMTSESEE